jgi:hypothetical protein
VRSQTVDEIAIASDVSKLTTSTRAKITWGKSSKDRSVMVKYDEMKPKEPSFSIFMKFNEKAQWFETVL